MMRRFARRRRSGSSGDGRAAPIDAARWLQRIQDEGLAEVTGLEPLQGPPADDVPDSYAALGLGEGPDGKKRLISFAPRSGGDAVLAGLATATALGSVDEPFDGDVIAIAPQWSSADRRRLGLIGDLPFSLRAEVASSLADGPAGVEADPVDAPLVLPVSRVAAQLSRQPDRELFARAAAALEGLASKHGGAVRGVGRSVELVLLARRVAELRAEESGIVLQTFLPQRSSLRLAGDELAAALDALEGNLRKRLNDRRIREGEEGLRARVVPLLSAAASLRATQPWPLGGSDQEALELVGLDASGCVVIGAVRRELGLPALSTILDASLALRASLPGMLAHAEAPVCFESPRLALAAESFGAAVARVLPALTIGHALFEITGGRDRGYELAPVSSGEAARRRATSGRSDRRGGRGGGRGRREPGAEEATEEPAAQGAREPRSAESAGVESGEGRDDGDRAGRGRGARRRGRRRGGRGEGDGAEPSSDRSSERAPETGGGDDDAPNFDEISMFDLDDEGAGSEDRDGARRRRGRSRRRGGRRSRGGAESEDAGAAEEGTPSEDGNGNGETRGGARRRPRSRKAEEAPAPASDPEDSPDDLEETLADLPDEVAFEPEPVVQYDDEDEDSDDDGNDKRRRQERERRRRERIGGSDVASAPKPKPRRRAVIVAHADRDSLLAAVLLARDLRLLEALWVYEQSELMNFFRGVATDLRDDTPIYLVGFTASPARDVLQGASLYRDRLTWFDHHDWPPEDLLGLKEAIGEDAVHVVPGLGTSLPTVLTLSTRRSRFTDKLVDLATSSFTQHDYERWGRLWWTRLAEIASRPGERRSEVDPLLVGRPSDLAKEAAKVETPPIPEEVAYASSRDFRLVHFGGYGMVVADVPPELDPHLTARIARERYGALLSVVGHQGKDVFSVAGEELEGRRAFDFGALAQHLADKLGWVEVLPDDDHVARVRIRGLADHPERLDEVVREIAMGRSNLER